MKELSLNILDIAQNSLAAGAKNVGISIEETEDTLRITVTDDGCGMTEEKAIRAVDPFSTSRTTRKVGLGIPLFKLAAEQTGGGITLESVPDSNGHEKHGTLISGLFNKYSIDFTPLGDIISTLCTLIQGLEGVNLKFSHTLPSGSVTLDTSELLRVLEGVPLSSPEVLLWIREYLEEQYSSLNL